MASLRVAVIALVFANILALAIWKGWLGGSVSHGEPERLSNQLNPEKIRLVVELPHPVAPPVVQPVAPPAPLAESVPPSAPVAEAGKPAAPEPVPAPVAPAPVAPAPEAAPPACVAFGGLNSEQAAELSARIAKAGTGFRIAESRSGTPSSWWVHIPSQGSKEGAERKAAELRGLGVTDLFIVQDAGQNQYAISLGLFKSEVAAGRQLEALKGRGVRSAQIATRGAGALRLEVRGPSDSLSSLASDLSENMRGASRFECAP
ncbi:MAG: SPOR domain-containing protein [Zoogloea sp.]|jgi:hypothetical protein|nr:SPOR domain-containing protein [Zoogloea sp.]